MREIPAYVKNFSEKRRKVHEEETIKNFLVEELLCYTVSCSATYKHTHNNNMSSLNELFKQLEVDSANEQHEEVFETAYEILKSSPHDARALKLVVVSLINLDRYVKALEVFKAAQAPQEALLLERLYVLYKLGMDKELSAELAALDAEQLSKNKGLAHLKAQFLYRTGDYDGALVMYTALVQQTDPSDAEYLDLGVNERAVLADGFQYGVFDRFHARSANTPRSEDSYDLLFNESVIQLGLGNYSNALELLEAAELKCKESTSDAAEEQFEETLPILLQRAYIYEITGKKSQANAILSELSQSQIGDELNKLIFVNNAIAAKIDESKQTNTNTHLVLKELRYPNLLNELAGRLSIVQKCQVWKNYWKLSSQVGKSITSKPFVKATDLTTTAIKSLAKAGVSHDDQPSTRAKKLTKYAISSKDVGASLMAAQMNLDVGKLELALSVLDSLDLDAKMSPGVASTILDLCDSTGSEKKKISTFEQLVSYYDDDSKFENVQVFDFLRVTALKFIISQPVQSKQLLTRLNAFHQDELIAVSLGQTGSEGLQSIEQLTLGLDFDSLVEDATVELTRLQKTKPSNFKIVKTRKRVMKKPPRELDLTKQADPERWLKLSDRSTYKPKNVKGKKNATQGGSADNITEESGLASKKTSNAPAQKKNKKKGRK